MGDYQFLTASDKTDVAAELGLVRLIRGARLEDGTIGTVIEDATPEEAQRLAERAHYKAALVAQLNGDDVPAFKTPSDQAVDAAKADVPGQGK